VSDVAARVDRLLTELFELEAGTVTESTRLREDLKLDSLDGVDLIVAIEKDFSIRVDDGALMKLRTVGEIHAYVVERLASSSS
jgi:acyl carrier protein